MSGPVIVPLALVVIVGAFFVARKVLTKRVSKKRIERTLFNDVDKPLFSQTAKIQDYLNKAVRKRGQSFAARLELSRIPISPAELIIYAVAGCLVILALSAIFQNFGLGLVACFAGLALVYLFISFRIGSVRKKFANQLDDNLQILAGALRSGYSLPQALTMLSTSSEEPSMGEITRVVNAQRLGVPIPIALSELAQRMDSEDFRLIAQAVAINAEVGGNISDVFVTVSKTIKDRNTLKRQVSALIAEGKLSAIVLSCLPVAMAILLSVISPALIKPLYTTLTGFAIDILMVIMLISGIVWMRKLINFKY